MKKLINQIKKNIKSHDKISSSYEKLHIEIFNPIEQNRLALHIRNAANLVKTNSNKKIALDYGCGTGNVSKHLADNEFEVYSADVSDKLLKITKSKLKDACNTVKLNGYDLKSFPDNYFDFTAIFSVLHHIPDYLSLIKELIRVTKKNGIVYLDHEQNESFWKNDRIYTEYREALNSNPESYKRKLKKLFNIKNYWFGIRRLFDKYYQEEGDIHVWPQDHISWGKIEKLLNESRCEIMIKDNYLLYRGYAKEVYEAFKDKCSDYLTLVARKL